MKTILLVLLIFVPSFTLHSQVVCPAMGTVSIYEGMPTYNFNGGSLLVGDVSGSEERSLMIFDVSSLGSCVDVSLAYIRIYYYTNSTCQDPINISIHKITSSWNDETVTWNNAPNWNSSSVGSWWPNYSVSYSNIVINSSLVEEWTESSNWGVLIKKNSGSGCSEFYQLNSSYPPELYVTYTNGTNSTAPSGASANPSSVCSGSSSTLTVSGGSLGTGAQWVWYSNSCGGTYLGTGNSISVSPTTTTTYYVRAVGNCNTTSCANLTVTVNTNSTAPSVASATPSSVCPGYSSTLTVSGGSLGTGAQWKWYSSNCGGTYLGSGNSISVSPTMTTTYYVRAEGDCNTTSCASVSVTVKLESAPPTSASANPPYPINTGEPVQLSVSGGSLGTGAIWAWYSNGCGVNYLGSGSSLTVFPGSTTNYYVRAEGDCNTTACSMVIVDVITGINIVNITDDIKLYPNPVKTKIYIETANSNIIIEKIELISIIGKVVYKSEKRMIKELTEIHVSHFEPGVYFVKMITSLGLVTRKIIIQK